jgi:methionyl-tRNA synthetase
MNYPCRRFAAAKLFIVYRSLFIKNMSEKFYITTPIFYVNDVPHIGHLYTSVICDVLARYHRLRDEDVFFLTGTDEHGSKIARAAEKAGLTPAKFTDKIAARFEEMDDTFNVSNDDFIRTTEERHIRGAQAFWQKVAAVGKIYKKKYSGLYCAGCESFKTEKDLIDGKCPDHNVVPEMLEEENYFFKLTDYKDQLLRHFKSTPNFVVPAGRFNEVKEWVNELEDISISRSRKNLNWGIPVPDDPDQVMYVWFDALTNYITATGYPDPKINKFWPADLQVIGKEISRFHAVLWPAMLWAAGLEAPRQIAVHGHISIDGKKMSKSLGNVINPFDLAEKYGVEPTRYFLLREIPFTSDGDLSAERIRERYTGDLANGVGNLVSRVLAMIEQFENGTIPAVHPGDIEPTWRAYEEHLHGFNLHLALADVWDVVADCDKMINDKKPWELAKTDPDALSKLLYVLAETIRHIGVMLWPFMPETAEKIMARLGLETEFRKEPLSELQTWGLLKPGTKVSKGDPLFPRLKDNN